MAPVQNGVQANGHPSLERISSGLEAASPDANIEMRNRALQRYRCASSPSYTLDALLQAHSRPSQVVA